MSSTTWVHRAARVVVRPLVHTAITPNHITTVRLLTGIAAAVAFAMGERAWDITGGVLFVLSAFLDRADGELARLSGRTSPLGHRYDLASDVACNVMAFAAIGIGLAHGPLGGAALLMGIVAAAAIAASFALVQHIDSTGQMIGSAGGFDPDDALFIVGPAAWFDGVSALLYAGAIGAPLCLAFMLWLYRRELARPAA